MQKPEMTKKTITALSPEKRFPRRPRSRKAALDPSANGLGNAAWAPWPKKTQTAQMNRMESNPATRSVVFDIRSIEDATATNAELISLDFEMKSLAGCENGSVSRKRRG